MSETISSIILLVFLTVLLSPAIVRGNAWQTTQFPNETFANALCKLTKDILQSENGSYDILLAKIDPSVENSVLGKMSKCLSENHPVVLADLTTSVEKQGLKKTGLIMIEMQHINLRPITSVINQQLKSNVFNHMSKVLLIVRGDNKPQLSSQILKHFRQLGFLNVAVVHNAFNKLYVDYAKDISMGLYATSNLSKFNLFFPDKLKNLKGYPIEIAIFSQLPRINIQADHTSGPVISFVKILRDSMNAMVEFPQTQTINDIAHLWKSRQMHLTLNTAIRMSQTENAPKLLTYEENGYCALVPKPSRTSVTELIFIKPFDRFVWLFLGLTVLACLVTWRLFYNRGTSDSFWLLMFGMFAMFVGQGVEFRRTNRVVLIILLQLIVSMIFVLSNGYQGVITSFMIQPENESRMKTVKEHLDSDMGILVSEYFADVVKDSKEFQAIRSKINIFNPDLLGAGDTILKSLDENRAIILKCSMVQSVMEWFDTVRNNYYKLPQNIISSLGYLGVGFHNPYLPKFQHLMDLSFEAGLPQAWTLFLGQNDYEVTIHSHELENLGLKDLSQVFCFLIIGHVIAFSVFLVEIFFHDFIDKIDLSYYTSKLRNYINELGKLKQKKQVVVRRKKNVLNKKLKRPKRPKPEKPKVRRIIVQPADSVV